MDKKIIDKLDGSEELYHGCKPEGMKPCPFCGGTDISVETVERHSHSSFLKDMGLPDCLGEMFISCDDCSCAIVVDGSTDINDAVKKWNTREGGK